MVNLVVMFTGLILAGCGGSPASPTPVVQASPAPIAGGPGVTESNSPTPGPAKAVDTQCYSKTGQVIAGQTQQNSSQNKNAVDCYDSKGTLVYAGAKMCYQELLEKYGSNFTYQAGLLFPKLYAEAEAQGAQAQSYLRQKLEASSCSSLTTQGSFNLASP